MEELTHSGNMGHLNRSSGADYVGKGCFQDTRDARQPPHERGSISEQLDRAMNALGNLRQRIHLLEERLAGVLASSQPTVTNSAAVATQPKADCGVAEAVAMIASGIDDCAGHVVSLRDRASI